MYKVTRSDNPTIWLAYTANLHQAARSFERAWDSCPFDVTVTMYEDDMVIDAQTGPRPW